MSPGEYRQEHIAEVWPGSPRGTLIVVGHRFKNRIRGPRRPGVPILASRVPILDFC